MKDVLVAESYAVSAAKQSLPLAKNCAFLWAIILFIFINLSCCLIKKVYEQHRSGYKSCDHIISTFNAQHNKANVILLGSSLMRMPFYLSDLKYTNNPPKYEHYCWSKTLQDLLQAKGFHNADVFNLSIDGAMASDMLLINKKLLQNSVIPEWIVYGIGPRDFVDNLFTKEIRTVVFDRLFTLNDLWTTENGFNMTLEEKLDMLMEKFCFLYDQREPAQKKLAHVYVNILSQLLPGDVKQSGHYVMTADGLQMHCDATDFWQKSVEEYRKRYKNFNYVQLSKQKDFFKTFCQVSQQKGIKILLVNMPITKDNLDLIPAKASIEYQKIISEAKQSPNISLLDLQQSEKFPRQFFRDTVHLNEKGGDLLCELIANALLAKR